MCRRIFKHDWLSNKHHSLLYLWWFLTWWPYDTESTSWSSWSSLHRWGSVRMAGTPHLLDTPHRWNTPHCPPPPAGTIFSCYYLMYLSITIKQIRFIKLNSCWWSSGINSTNMFFFLSVTIWSCCILLMQKLHLKVLILITDMYKAW